MLVIYPTQPDISLSLAEHIHQTASMLRPDATENHKNSFIVAAVQVSASAK